VAEPDRRVATAVLLVLGAMLVSLVLATVAGCDAGPASPAPATTLVVRPAPSSSITAPNGVDALFATMMVAHHAQAVSMSKTLLAKPEAPERVLNIAGFIAHDQQREIGEMNAWLQAWGRPPVDPADPAIEQLHGPGAGHGMLTDAQLAEITRADPTAATGLYLRHMIEHHRGAITMARSALDGGANAYIRGLAKHIINEQSAENDTMSRLLAELH
jgi:uncharacterized protein (DUF305 family)